MTTMAAGVLAGLAATAPMTAAMAALHQELPREEQYPLPPREVTLGMAEKAGVAGELQTEEAQRAATWTAHFAYGAGMGALYAGLAEQLPGPPAARGVVFGLAVWAGSYLGWLPAAGIRAGSTKQPPRREAIMVAAHVVYGASLGLLYDQLSNS